MLVGRAIAVTPFSSLYQQLISFPPVLPDRDDGCHGGAGARLRPSALRLALARLAAHHPVIKNRFGGALP